jgi:hypothetical protein
MALTGSLRGKRVVVRLPNIAKNRKIGEGIRKLIDLEKGSKRTQDNREKLSDQTDENVHHDERDREHNDDDGKHDINDVEVVAGSSKYADSYSSCSDSEIMEIFQRSSEDRMKRKKGWEEKKKIKKRKYINVQLSDSESDCEVLPDPTGSTSAACSEASRGSSSSLEILEERMSESNTPRASSNCLILLDESRSGSVTSIPPSNTSISTSHRSIPTSSTSIPPSHSSIPPSSNYLHSSLLPSTNPSFPCSPHTQLNIPRNKNLESTFDTDTGDDEEYLKQQFERKSSFKIKKVRVDIKEEHPFLERIKPVRIKLFQSRAKLRRLFSSQKKELNESVKLRTSAQDVVCPVCNMRFSLLHFEEFATHVKCCKILSMAKSSNDDPEILLDDDDEVVDVEVEIDEVEELENTLPCPKCNEEVPESGMDEHLWFHRPFPCSICFHRYIKKMDIEDHIINDHATHFMSSLLPIWRSDEAAIKAGLNEAGLKRPALKPVSMRNLAPVPDIAGFQAGNIKLIIRESDGTQRSVFIAPLPSGAQPTGNLVIINDQKYQMLNTGGMQVMQPNEGTPMPRMPLPQQPLPRANLLPTYPRPQGPAPYRIISHQPRPGSMQRSFTSKGATMFQDRSHPSTIRRNLALGSIRPSLGVSTSSTAGNPMRPMPRILQSKPTFFNRKPTIFSPSSSGLNLDSDGAPVQSAVQLETYQEVDSQSDHMSFDYTQMEDPLAI